MCQRLPHRPEVALELCVKQCIASVPKASTTRGRVKHALQSIPEPDWQSTFQAAYNAEGSFWGTWHAQVGLVGRCGHGRGGVRYRQPVSSKHAEMPNAPVQKPCLHILTLWAVALQDSKVLPKYRQSTCSSTTESQSVWWTCRSAVHSGAAVHTPGEAQPPGLDLPAPC